MAVQSIPEDNLTFSTITAILVFDIFLYMALTWYIEGIYPGRYGVSKPWYFPFMPSYWCGQKGRGLGLSHLFKRSGATPVKLDEDEGETEMKGVYSKLVSKQIGEEFTIGPFDVRSLIYLLHDNIPKAP